MKLHPAFVAIVSVVAGINVIAYAAILSTSRPTPKTLVQTTPTALSTLKPTVTTSPVPQVASIVLEPVKVVTTTSRVKAPKKVPETVERCREVGLDQGAEEGKTVIYCETYTKE